MKNYCEIIFSLNKYKGSLCRSVNDAEFVFVTEQTRDVDIFCDGCYKLNVYHKGEIEDYYVNGWSFSNICYGGFHIRGSYECVNIKVEACAPNGECGGFELDIRDTSDFRTEAASLYMSIVMLVSLCDSLDDAKVMFNTLKYGLSSYDIQESLTKLKIIKRVIEKAKGNNEISEKWMQSAESKYILMYNKFVENVSKEELLKLLFV